MRFLIIQIYVIISLIIRFFIPSLCGMFILTILLYLFYFRLTGIQPLGFEGLIYWFLDLQPAYKTSLLSSLLTIIGFLIAFHVATANWRNQLRANLRLEAAKDIDLTYSRITHLISSIKIYANMNLDLIQNIKAKLPDNELLPKLNFVLSQVPDFLSNRNELSILHIKSFEFYGRYSNVLFSTWNSFDQLEMVNKSVERITSKMWILVPIVDLNSPNFKEMYLSYVDEGRLKELSEQCEESHGYVSGVSGSVRGMLTSSLVEFNVSWLINFIRKGKFMKTLLSEIKSIQKKYHRTTQ